MGASHVQPTFIELAAECFAGTLDGASDLIVERASRGVGGYVCLCNVHVLSMARRDQRLRTVLSEAWMRMPDGAPVAWLQRRLGHRSAERVGGPDLMAGVLEAGQPSGLRHFFLGSTPLVLGNLERRVRGSLPGINIVGSLSPPFRPLDSEIVQSILGAMQTTRPHVAWVGLGAPKQEYWMHRLAADVPSVLLVGVGAAFDFLAGTTPRAPAWMQTSGLEWLHRLLHDPRRLSGRYFRTNTEFVLATTLDLSRRRFTS